MTRRRKAFIYTWLVSWAIAVPILLGWIWAVSNVTSLLPYWDWATKVLPHSVALLPLASPMAVAFAPVVYLSWRAVDRWLPPQDEAEE